MLLRIACEHGLEGIVGKDRNSTYRSGRLGDWVKIKCVWSDGFLIVGYEKSAASFGGIGRLLLAARKGDELVYVGGVGTGFNERSAGELRKQMDKLIIGKPVVDTGRKRNAVFVRPKLVAEIEYRACTHDGKLRHASYKGFGSVRTMPTFTAWIEMSGGFPSHEGSCFFSRCPLPLNKCATRIPS